MLSERLKFQTVIKNLHGDLQEANYCAYSSSKSHISSRKGTYNVATVSFVHALYTISNKRKLLYCWEGKGGRVAILCDREFLGEVTFSIR